MTRIFFAALLVGMLASCGNGQSATVPAAQPVAAFIGDSYTVGNGASDVNMRWSTLVAKQMGWEEKNFGVGGTGYLQTKRDKGAYANRVDQVVHANPSIVVVSGGQNDARSEFDATVCKAVEAVRGRYVSLLKPTPAITMAMVLPTNGT